MDMLKTMSVQEQTLYKKWREFNKSDKLRSKADKLDQVQQQMWTPTDLSDKEKNLKQQDKRSTSNYQEEPSKISEKL